MSQMDLFPTPSILSRSEAIQILKPFLGQNLREISDQLGVTKFGEVAKNHGWAGHTVEWLLGSSPNNQQAADFGEWELKVTSVEQNHQGQDMHWRPRGHMILTSVQPAELVKTSFEDSHLFQKCQQLLIACRLHSSSTDTRSELVALCEYDLKGAHFSEIKQEYEELQWALREHGLMGAQEVRLQRLGLQAGGASRGGGRWLARKAWVEEMIRIGLRQEQKEGV